VKVESMKSIVYTKSKYAKNPVNLLNRKSKLYSLVKFACNNDYEITAICNSSTEMFDYLKIHKEVKNIFINQKKYNKKTINKLLELNKRILLFNTSGVGMIISAGDYYVH
jgi:hypothetical protein